MLNRVRMEFKLTLPFDFATEFCAEEKLGRSLAAQYMRKCVMSPNEWGRFGGTCRSGVRGVKLFFGCRLSLRGRASNMLARNVGHPS